MNMATAQKVSYFAMQVPNRAGEAGRILAGLAKAGINLLAFTGFPSGRHSQMDFIPANATTFLAVARGMKLRLRDKKTGFLIRGTDQRGAIAKIMSKLAVAKINVTAVDAVCAGAGRFGAILWVKQKDVTRAARALGA
jgi:prephenate dehydratase